jgi:site-specific DNA-methyltransferase (adenine-specific)
MKKYIETTNAPNTTETAIGFIPCYRLPFLRQKDVEIWNESNLETMKNMPDNHIDLTVTSPPYDNLRDYKGYSFLFEEIAKELYRVTKEGGIVVWIVGDSTINGSESLTSFKQAIYFVESCGFNLHDTMIYHKDNFAFPYSNRYYQTTEYMFVLSKGTPKTTNLIQVKTTHFRINNSSSTKRQADGTLEKVKYETGKETRAKENIWKYGVGNGKSTNDKIAFKHPATFPEDLARDHIYTWSNEGDLVYDCFGGSGTTAKMAHLQKRKSIMSEISLEYCQIAKKRIEPYLMQECLF